MSTNSTTESQSGVARCLEEGLGVDGAQNLYCVTISILSDARLYFFSVRLGRFHRHSFSMREGGTR